MIISFIIIAVTVIVSIYAWKDIDVFNQLKLNPYMVVHDKEYLRLLGHGFLHVDYTHLIFNMFTFYFFGSTVEKYFKLVFDNGAILFILFYIISIAVSSITSIVKHKDNYYYNAVGASGAVSAILFASILFNPQSEIMLALLPIPIPGYVFGIAYLLLSHYLGKKSNDNINHDAHIAGAIFGIIFPIILKPSLVTHFINSI